MICAQCGIADGRVAGVEPLCPRCQRKQEIIDDIARLADRLEFNHQLERARDLGLRARLRRLLWD